MDAKIEKKLREKVIDCCGDSRSSDAFKYMNDDEYVGYQTAMVVSNSYNISASVEEKYNMVKTCFKEGIL